MKKKPAAPKKAAKKPAKKAAKRFVDRPPTPHASPKGLLMRELNPEHLIALVIAHALISAGASPSEKTIDEAIKAGELLTKKLDALESADDATHDPAKPVKPADPAPNGNPPV